MFDYNNKPNWNKAVIFFCKSDVYWFLKFLKPKFRHCGIILNDGENSIQIESTKFGVNVSILPIPINFDIKKWHEMSGRIALEIDLKNKEYLENKMSIFDIFSCVSLVKRLLSLNDFRIFTPYSLYKFLKNAKSKKKILDKNDLLGYNHKQRTQ